MATLTPPTDLYSAWKALYDRVESTFAPATQQLLQTEGYAAALGLAREQYVTALEMTREGLEAYWENLRLSTKTDLSRVAGQIVTLEYRVEALEDTLEAVSDKLDALLAIAESAAPKPAPKPAPQSPRKST